MKSSRHGLIWNSLTTGTNNLTVYLSLNHLRYYKINNKNLAFSETVNLSLSRLRQF